MCRLLRSALSVCYVQSSALDVQKQMRQGSALRHVNTEEDLHSWHIPVTYAIIRDVLVT